MVRLIGNFFTKITRKFLPDAFIFALILTLIVFLLGILIQGVSPLKMTSYFGDGIWTFLEFAMQMVLILVTGSALATSKPVHNSLKSISKIAQSPTQAIILVSVVMIVGCWLNWGFGLIVSALIAKELAKNIKGIHYPLLIASAYSGFIVWHVGFSGSIPLKVAGADNIMQEFGDGAVIPVTDTIFLWKNILLIIVFLITIPLINKLMIPKNKAEIIEADPALFINEEKTQIKPMNQMTFAEKLENSWILSMLIGAIGLVFLINYFYNEGNISLNIVNFIFLILGIILHKSPIKYVRAVNEGIKTCGGIVLQFPFYAGIMGMMIHSGLAVSLSEVFVNISNQTTLPFFTFLSAGIVNFFVPSGGGQWAVQGPIMIPASKVLNVPYSTTIIAIAWGDAWTNLVQPFWALPLLAVAKLKIRDIMGYTTVILIVSGIIISLFMLFVF